MAESPPIPPCGIHALNNIVSIFHSFGVIYSNTVQVTEELDQVPMYIGVGYLESKNTTKVALKNIYNKKTQGVGMCVITSERRRWKCWATASKNAIDCLR